VGEWKKVIENNKNRKRGGGGGGLLFGKSEYVKIP